MKIKNSYFLENFCFQCKIFSFQRYSHKTARKAEIFRAKVLLNRFSVTIIHSVNNRSLDKLEIMSPRNTNEISENKSGPDFLKCGLDLEKQHPLKTEFTYEEALVSIGFGRVQLYVLIVSGICLMAVINETVGMSIISLSSLCDLETDTQKRAILSATGFIGIFLSSHMWGYLADTTGRRNVMMISVFISNVFSLLSMFASNYWTFVVLRCISNLKWNLIICRISGPSACVYAYIGEFNTNKYRPVITNYASFFVGLSNIFIPGN